MAEQSYLFDFSRVDSFIENINVAFFIDEMFKVTGYDTETHSYTYEDDNIDDNFQLFIAEYGEDNIEYYLDSDGFLKQEIEFVEDGQGNLVQRDDVLIEDCALDYYNRGYGSSTIELHGDVEFSIRGANDEDINVPIKAIFLRSKSTNYVMGYSINMRPFTVTNKVVFDDDVIFWDISRYNQ